MKEEIINRYMQFVTSIEKSPDCIIFHVGNADKIIATKMHIDTSPGSLWRKWYEKGKLTSLQESYIKMQYEINGKNRYEFDNMMIFTEKNATYLAAECIRMREMGL